MYRYRGLLREMGLILSKRFLQVKDTRDTGKVDHRLHDFFMSAFAMMYFQDPSLLAFQRKLQNSTNLILAPERNSGTSLPAFQLSFCLPHFFQFFINYSLESFQGPIL